MTELSPQAQAVLDAADAVLEQAGAPTWLVARGMAAALRAAADQVVPPHLETEFYDRNPSLALQEAVWIRTELLAIAAELEGGNG